MSPSDQIKPAGSDLKQLGNGRILAFRHVAPNHNGPGKAVGGELGVGGQIPPQRENPAAQTSSHLWLFALLLRRQVSAEKRCISAAALELVGL